MLTEAQGERIAAEASYRNASRMSAASLAATLPDPSLQTLRDELLEARAKYQAHLKDFGPNHRQMVALRSRIAAMEDQLSAAGKQALGQLRAAYNMALEKERQLKASLEEASATASQEDQELIQLLILQREVDIAQEDAVELEPHEVVHRHIEVERQQDDRAAQGGGEHAHARAPLVAPHAAGDHLPAEAQAPPQAAIALQGDRAAGRRGLGPHGLGGAELDDRPHAALPW